MTKQSSSKKSSSGAAAAEVFGPFVESNGNYIALRESMLAYANEQADQPDFEDVLWQKPQDFAKSNEFAEYDTRSFRDAYTKMKHVIQGKSQYSI